METIKLQPYRKRDYLISLKKLYKASIASIKNDLSLNNTERKTQLENLKQLFKQKRKNFNHRLF